MQIKNITSTYPQFQGNTSYKHTGMPALESLKQDTVSFTSKTNEDAFIERVNKFVDDELFDTDLCEQLYAYAQIINPNDEKVNKFLQEKIDTTKDNVKKEILVELQEMLKEEQN
ncbi:MAG: hypothetical protein A2287_06495 [Candidatus Melainabacteria bacterium RIFOXYA12_FULL_32_12]|nr:MAG: hypothetical protein A2255_04690 [Candidatus Melainabacteria bacterium RIFOXYA2_FULL_32_9]OGI26329.1 MAG: hypothetical protein A2287_06495 [Candidatus Melainabacteria bacterium RIFOXYA12_FULL_32_12]